MSSHQLKAAIELGGTKTICLVGEDVSKPMEKKVFPTKSPEETLPLTIDFFKQFDEIVSLGIGSFGPINIDRNSNDYGVIQNTPKKNWSNVNLKKFYSDQLSCPIVIDTDVNAAALGEYKLGAGIGLKNFIYVTVGTGIGGGAFVDGKALSGLSHPEMGHMILNRAPNDTAFKSSCPFHENCAEGLASGSAISARWGKALNHFPEDSEQWRLEAYYLSDFAYNLTLLFSPQKIIFGGGVSTEALMSMVRENLKQKLNNYLPELNSHSKLVEYITLPKLDGDAGPLGSFLLNDYAEVCN